MPWGKGKGAPKHVAHEKNALAQQNKSGGKRREMGAHGIMARWVSKQGAGTGKGDLGVNDRKGKEGRIPMKETGLKVAAGKMGEQGDQKN